MSTKPQKTREILFSINKFNSSEANYINITSTHGISLTDLFNASKTTYISATALGFDLSGVFSNWSLILASSTDESAENNLRSMLVHLSSSIEELNKLKANSSNLNVKANDVMGKLQGLSKQLHNDFTTQQEQINQCNTNIVNTVNQINSINSQLSGSSGFWEGFKTGISLGIYSGLRDKLSQQKSLRDRYNNEKNQIQNAQQQTQRDIVAISQIDPIVQHVTSLDTNVVAIENIILNLNELAKKTEHDGSKTGSGNKKVAEYYKEHFGVDMQQLLLWKNVFPN